MTSMTSLQHAQALWRDSFVLQIESRREFEQMV
jgi:hypothetical protein